MRTYLVEVYHATDGLDALARAARQARAAAEEMARHGAHVRFIGSIGVPEDELTFHLYQASSAAVVDEASRLATIEFERVLEVSWFGFERS